MKEKESYKYRKVSNEVDEKDKKISELEARLADSEKKFIVANNLSKNSDEVLLNYKTKKYGLDKTIQELRKMKLNLPEKEWYYKGFENCERQISSHIADLTLEVKQLKHQLAEKEKEIQRTHNYYQAVRNRETIRESKISFAVDILEELADCSNYINSKLGFESGSYVPEKSIRDKIKYLKGNKYE